MARVEEHDEAGIIAFTVAASLIRVYGGEALAMIQRQIGRCMEDDLTDEAAFWLRVRNRADTLLRTARRKSDTVH
jgi:hypothetical protein